jgi:hypothetical protein
VNRTFIIALAVGAAVATANADLRAQGGPRGSGTPSGGPSQIHLPPPKPIPDARAAEAPFTAIVGQTQIALERLSEDLRINSAQDKAWSAYATRILKLADDIARARFIAREALSGEIAAPQMFERILETAQNRMTAVEEIVDSGRALYAVLTPEQQRIADKRLAMVALQLASGSQPGAPMRPGDGPAPKAP